jgi:hypothetical protein
MDQKGSTELETIEMPRVSQQKTTHAEDNGLDNDKVNT